MLPLSDLPRDTVRSASSVTHASLRVQLPGKNITLATRRQFSSPRHDSEHETRCQLNVYYFKVIPLGLITRPGVHYSDAAVAVVAAAAAAAAEESGSQMSCGTDHCKGGVHIVVRLRSRQGWVTVGCITGCVLVHENRVRVESWETWSSRVCRTASLCLRIDVASEATAQRPLTSTCTWA